jgi:COP9 signalosome complex subunit 3
MLTSTHCLLARYAYETGCIDPILRLIEKPIAYYPGMASVPSPIHLCDMTLPPPSYMSKILTHDLKPQNVLEYDLLCGLIWCSKRNWGNAFDAFERVISYPTKDNGVSQIMSEAYKKWVLVGLLLTGQMPPEPAYTSTAAKKAYNVLARPYTALAELFVTTNAAQLMSDAAKSQQFWAGDGNTTLIAEVLSAYQKWQIIILQDVYSKISIADIRLLTQSAETGTTLASDEEVEALIVDMIEWDMLRGVLEKPEDGKPAYLTFLPDEDKFSEADFAQKLADSARRIKALGTIFKATNERLATSKDYVRHLAREQKKLETQGGDKADLGGMTFDSQIEDEDLMTGLVTTT